MFEILQSNQTITTMKPLLTIFGLGLLLSLGACTIQNDGDVGPAGPRGATGPQGEPGEESYVFEYENVSFTGPDYTVVLPIADDFGFVSLDSDVTLVYFLWETDEVDGEIVEVWRPIPQNILTPDGLIQYNFDWTIYDVKLFMDAEFPLDLLTAMDTDDWVVRVVVVPGQFWNGGRKEHPSYEEVKEKYNLPDLSVSHKTKQRRD